MSVKIALQQLKKVLILSRSLSLLEYFAEIYATTEYKTTHLEVDRCIQLYVNNLENVSEQPYLDEIFEMCSNTDTFKSLQRYKISKDILCPLIKYGPLEDVEIFYRTNFRRVLDILKLKETNETSVVNKAIAMMLIEHLFAKIDATAENPLNLSSEHPIENLSKTFAAFCLDTSLQNNSGVDAEIIRIYRCHAYIAFASIVCNTKKNEIEPYCYLLRCGRFGWNHLIDANKIYTFTDEETDIPKKRQVLLNIRDEIKVLRKSSNINMNTVKYIESEHLFNSTLNEDIGKYDLASCVLDANTQETIRDIRMKTNQMVVVLKTIDINNHECMPTVCGIVKHIVTYVDVPLENEEKLPKWASMLKDALMNDSNFKNVKIFIAKVIENMREQFKIFAKWFAEPIIKLIVDGNTGDGISFFTADLVS